MFFSRSRKNEEENPSAEEVSQAASRVARESEEKGKKKADKYLTCPMPGCKSGLVHPVKRDQMSKTEWKVLLLCPNCLTKREVTIERETLRRLLKESRLGREKIMKELDLMIKRHMEEEVDKFITALQKDQILPEDFVSSKNNNPNEAWIQDMKRIGRISSPK